MIKRIKRLIEIGKRFVEIYCFHNHNQLPQITAVFFNHGYSAVFHQSQPISLNHGCSAVSQQSQPISINHGCLISNLQFLISNSHGKRTIQ
jgi:hypothetical protein